MKLTVLAGGVGGARFLVGVREVLRPGFDSKNDTIVPESDDHKITAIVNIGDDAWMHDLRLCPDLDSCMYTLGGGIDPQRGWGRANETWHLKEELAAYGAKPDWFGLGDRDTATHLIRSQMLRAGYRLSAITEALCKRWNPGVELLPASDDRCETYAVISDPADNEQRAIHFQEWWVRHRAKVETHSFVYIGAEQASPAPGVLEAIAEADVVLIAPSNPVVSISSILAIPGIRGALRTTAAPVIGVSPIIDGAPLRGMADTCLRVVGTDATAAGVANYYGARSAAGILDGWLVHPGDDADVTGLKTRATPILMRDTDATAAIVRDALDLAGFTL